MKEAIKRPVESDYLSHTAYTRALEAYCDEQEQGEPAAWMYDWTSDEGEFIQDWTTSMAETLRDTGKTVITNVRPLYLAPQVIHKPLQHFGEIPMAWCRWSEHLGKWMYTHRQPTEELAWIPLYDHPPQLGIGERGTEAYEAAKKRGWVGLSDERLMEMPKQEQGEPVAWMFQHEETGRITFVETQQIEWGFEKNNPRLKKIGPLYTSPPKRKPLTLGQKQRLWSSVGNKLTLKDRVNSYGLAIEAAHGIKE